MRAEWSFRSTDLLALRAARESALELLRAGGTPESDVDACAVILSELMTNAAKHGPRGRIGVVLDWSDAEPRFMVRDGGSGFVPNIGLPPPTSEGGRGLYIVTRLAAAPTVTVDRSGCTVAVRLPAARVA